MDIDVKKEAGKLKAEIAQLQKQLQQLEQARNNQVAEILKKQGFLEGLQELDGDKPKET